MKPFSAQSEKGRCEAAGMRPRRHGEKEQQVLAYDAAKAALLKEIGERRDWRVQPLYRLHSQL